MLTDAHAHLNDSAFVGELESIYNRCIEEGVGYIINSAWDLTSSIKAYELSQKYHNMYFTVGVHPHNAIDVKSGDLDALIELSKHPKCVAWGEIGLDYHYDLSPREIQREFFDLQIKIANSLNLPIVLHLREAYDDANAILKNNKNNLNNGILLHCYSGSMELARDFYNKLDCYYSFGGAITFKNNNKKTVLNVIPKDRIMLETDCPYMTPVPFRGQKNSPAFLRLIRDKMALDLDITPLEVEHITQNNLLRFYRIKR